jgi:hypothetical protein
MVALTSQRQDEVDDKKMWRALLRSVNADNLVWYSEVRKIGDLRWVSKRRKNVD